MHPLHNAKSLRLSSPGRMVKVVKIYALKCQNRPGSLRLISMNNKKSIHHAELHPSFCKEGYRWIIRNRDVQSMLQTLFAPAACVQDIVGKLPCGGL